MYSSREVAVLKELLPELAAVHLPLRIRMADGSAFDFDEKPQVTLAILDPALLPELRHSSLDSLAEAYVEGRMDIEGPLLDAVDIARRLSAVMPDGEAMPHDSHPDTPNAHEREDDARAISYHYNLSNDFYKLWLDPEMVYSCAYFENGDENLAAAQLAKMRLLCRKLRLQAGERLLDVGCGWGGLVRLAAKEFGVEVLGITLSIEQLNLAWKRVKAEGLQHKVQLELMDYRDLPDDGRFDKVVSVGMFEHVGHANLPLYFRKLHDCVRPGGLVLNHGITAHFTDALLQTSQGGGNFISRHVFPQGEIPHLAVAISALSDAGLEVVDVESLRRHYARTLEFWSRNLEAKREKAASLVDAKSLRIWRLYLAGCAYGFQQGWVNLHQILATRPHADGHLELPWTRHDIYEYEAGQMSPKKKKPA
ncbi:MAG: class I SAM-dependent methyltransferase [Pedobacter sp.]|nr:class I SAM-dependent methyltransferase [Pedobacter sp.]